MVFRKRKKNILLNETESVCTPRQEPPKDENEWRYVRCSLIMDLDPGFFLRNDKPLDYIQGRLESSLKHSDAANREDYKEKLEWNAKIIYEYKANHKNICPNCGHINPDCAHYCVMCGKLLMLQTEKKVVNQTDFDELCLRPDISQTEYKVLKRRAEMSVGEHIRSYISNNIILELAIFIGCALAFTLFTLLLFKLCFGYFDNKETPEIEICKGDNGYGLRWNDSNLPVLGANCDSILRRTGNYAYYKDGLMGIVSSNGKIITPCIYLDVQNNIDSMMWVQHRDGHIDLINSKGRILTNGHYDRVEWDCMSDKYAAVVGYYADSESTKAPKRTPNYAIIDINGKFLLKDCWWIYGYSQGLAAVQPTYKDSIVYVDIEGKVVFPARHGSSDKPRIYERFSLWKDEKGHNVIPSFKNDTARIMINGEKCYLFRDGKYVRAGE